jgi:hypothetical protein
MSKVERGQYASLLRRYLGMTGVSDVIDELAPEMSAVFVLESERPEWEFLKGARLLGYAQTVPALAGNNSAIRLRNPTNSGVVAIVTHLSIGSNLATSSTVTHGAQPADQATINGYGIRDGRQTPNAGAIIASSGYAALGGSAIDACLNGANTCFKLWNGINDTAVVLAPGFALNVGHNVANIDLVVGVHWLEKRLDALEAS